MKILLVNEYFAPVGGTEQYLISTSHELERRGYQEAVIYGRKTGEESSIKGQSYLIPHTFDLQSGDNPKGIKILESIIEKEKPNLIYIHQVNNPSVLKTMTKWKPCIRYVHGYKISCPAGHRSLLKSGRICTDTAGFRCMLRAYTERCMPRNPKKSFNLVKACLDNMRAHLGMKRFIVASRYMKTMLVKSGIPQEMIEIIPYFTPLPVLDRKTEKKSSVPHILFIGRLVPAKGVPFLLKALASLDCPWQCSIIGDGPDREYIQNMARQLNLDSRISLPGWRDRTGLDKYYRQARLVAVPSIWPEPFGIVGIEAMSYGKPVVAFDVGGISEWLENGVTGYLVPRKDVAEMARRIDTLLNNGKAADKFGKKGRLIVERRFTKDIHMKKLMKVFEKVRAEGE